MTIRLTDPTQRREPQKIYRQSLNTCAREKMSGKLNSYSGNLKICLGIYSLNKKIHPNYIFNFITINRAIAVIQKTLLEHLESKFISTTTSPSLSYSTFKTNVKYGNGNVKRRRPFFCRHPYYQQQYRILHNLFFRHHLYRTAGSFYRLFVVIELLLNYYRPSFSIL